MQLLRAVFARHVPLEASGRDKALLAEGADVGFDPQVQGVAVHTQALLVGEGLATVGAGPGPQAGVHSAAVLLQVGAAQEPPPAVPALERLQPAVRLPVEGRQDFYNNLLLHI